MKLMRFFLMKPSDGSIIERLVLVGVEVQIVIVNMMNIMNMMNITNRELVVWNNS